MEVGGPEREGQQGLEPAQWESGDRAILALLEDPEVRDQVDLVLTCREGTYEAWSRRGMVRFRRVPEEGGARYETVEQLGEDPLARQDPTLLASLEEELRVSGSDDPDACYFEPEQLSHPFAHERIAQLFDSPLAPDLVISPKAYAFGIQRGQHGALDVVQSRAPLAFAGPGVRPGIHPRVARHVDVAPTVCHLAGLPLTDGIDGLGRPARTYLRRQDGEVLDWVVDPDGSRPEHVYVIVLDGLSHTELFWRIEREPASIPNLRALLSRAAIARYGSIVNFPSITWPSHSTLVTGTWGGHHDVVNPTYYLRDRREVVSPQGQLFDTEHFLSDGVETLYEAFGRTRNAFTASINEPQGRGAHHAAFERRVIGDRTRLRALTKEFMEGFSPRFREHPEESIRQEAFGDARGMAQMVVLFDDPERPPPELAVHELFLTDGVGHEHGPHSPEVRAALDETDVRVGQVLDLLRRRGVAERTLFVVTSDHGMAAQDVSLAANPAWHPHRIGMKTVTAEPMIWLRDVRVSIRRASDGRTCRIEVTDGDAAPAGDHLPVEGAHVDVVDRPDRRIAHGVTDPGGRLAFQTPADVPSDRIAIAVRHPDYNPRHLTLAGKKLGPDPRRLYR